jgi:hypothetical protein
MHRDDVGRGRDVDDRREVVVGLYGIFGLIAGLAAVVDTVATPSV